MNLVHTFLDSQFSYPHSDPEIPTTLGCFTGACREVSRGTGGRETSGPGTACFGGPTAFGVWNPPKIRKNWGNWGMAPIAEAKFVGKQRIWTYQRLNSCWKWKSGARSTLEMRDGRFHPWADFEVEVVWLHWSKRMEIAHLPTLSQTRSTFLQIPNLFFHRWVWINTY